MQHVYAARHLFPLFEARGQGAMLVTASAAGLLTQVGSLPYAVTKAAAVSIAEWLAISYGGKGINVSCLCPQAVESAMTAGGTGAAGAAGTDGVISAEQVTDDVLSAMAEGRFMITPHEAVRKYIVRKATDYDRWIKGMRRMHDTFGNLMLRAPLMSAAKL